MKLVKRFDITDISQSEIYLRRWSMWLPFGWSLKLHHILRSDSDRCQHDHPWGFWTLILWGGYDELVGIEQTMNRMRPECFAGGLLISGTESRSCRAATHGRSFSRDAEIVNGVFIHAKAGCTGAGL